MKMTWRIAALCLLLLALAAAAMAEGGTLNLPSGTRTIEEEAFYGLQGVSRVNLPSGVRLIGPRAFGNSGVAEIQVPTSNDLRISNDALDGSPNARFVSSDALWYGVFKYAVDGDHVVIKKYLGTDPEMVIPAEIDGLPVTHIAASAFSGRQDLTSAVIPEGIVSIGESAFYDCYALAQADIPSTVTAIGTKAFSHNRALQRAVLPEGLLTLGTEVFYDCKSLESVQLPASLATIGDYMFSGCTKLAHINIPAGLTAIGRDAFANACVNQPGNPVYTLPESLETVGTGAFYNCGAALSVVRNGSVEALVRESGYTLTHPDRLDYRYQYKKVNDAWILYLTRYVGAGGDVSIPAGPVVIGESAFADNSDITGVTVPAGVTLIDRNAFYRCANLARAAMPDSVTTINANAFYACANLTDVTFPANLSVIEADAFEHTCTAAGTHFYNLPDHITRLGWTPFGESGAVLCFNRGSDTAALFQQNQYIYTYTGETDFRYRWYSNEGTEGHQERLIQYTGSAQTVNIPAYIWLIDDNAFKGNTTLKKVVIPEGVTQIGNNAFQDCANLTDITLPDSLTFVKNNVFRGCGANAEAPFLLTLPDGIGEVWGDVFTDCPAILLCGIDTTTADRISNRGWSFARNDRPDELDIRYKYGYVNNVWKPKLYDYVGSLTSIRLPDDCPNVDNAVLRQKVSDGLELVCGQLSDTAEGISRAGMSFTFPGHEGLRYRIIDNVLYIMGYAGAGTSIDIPAATAYIAAGWDEQIRAGAFQGNGTVTRVVVPEGVTRINADAFSGCTNLTDITLPDSLKSMDQKVFRYAGQNLAAPFYLTLPDHMEDLMGRNGGANSFEDLNAVLVCGKTSQTAALLSDRNYVYTCPGEYDFRYRYDIPTNYSSRQLWLVGYEGDDAQVTIPSGIYGVRRFSGNTTDSNWPTFHGDGFYGNTVVTKVVIPEGTVDIRSDVFTNCYNLTDITFPSTLKRLDQNVFRYCGRDAEAPFYFVLPDDMEDMVGRGGGAQTFSDCDAILQTGKYSKTAELLTDRNFCYTVAGEHDFRYRYLSYAEGGEIGRRLWLVGFAGEGPEVTIPAGIYGVRNYQWDAPYGSYEPDFFGRTDITKVVIPEGTVVIEDSAFKGCTNLTDITFPGTLKVLKNHAFEQCGKDATTRHYYVLPDDMEEISTNVDSGWGAFTDINLGRIVTSPDCPTALQLSGIDTYNHGGVYRFSLKGHETDGLRYLYKTYNTDDGPVNRLVLMECEGTATDVAIPADCGIWRIENNAFKDRADLQSVVIPAGVVELGSSAFDGCAVLHDGEEQNVIVIPNTVKRAENLAFRDLGAAITERFFLVLPASLSEFDINIFTGCNAVLVAPAGSPVAQALFNNWYYYYNTLEDAIAQQNCRFQVERDAQGNVVPHNYNGKR